MDRKDRFTAEAEWRATRPYATENLRRREARRRDVSPVTGFVTTLIMLLVGAALALRALGVL